MLRPAEAFFFLDLARQLFTLPTPTLNHGFLNGGYLSNLGAKISKGAKRGNEFKFWRLINTRYSRVADKNKKKVLGVNCHLKLSKGGDLKKEFGKPCSICKVKSFFRHRVLKTIFLSVFLTV